MKRNVQILLLIACMVPLLVPAEEETMEERKRRITRKYLRERMDITYSEEEVPGNDVEAGDVLASEILRQSDGNLERYESGPPQPPPGWQPAVRTRNRNWLLADPVDPTDPYADPFAREDFEDEPKKNDWTVWEMERTESPYTDTQRESRFNWREYDPSSGKQPGSYDTTSQGEMADPRTSYGVEMQSGFSQQRGNTFGSSEWLDQSRWNTYNSTFNQNRIQNPAQGKTEIQANPFYNPELPQRAGSFTPYKSPYQIQREQRQEQWGGYTPYKSPYQIQREQRQEQWGNYTEPEPEYQRKDPFQQWKQKNAIPFNPMSDDAFIQETMPKPRR